MAYRVTTKNRRDKDDARLGGEGACGTGTAIQTTCAKCKTVSLIKITRPAFTVESDKGSICSGLIA